MNGKSDKQFKPGRLIVIIAIILAISGMITGLYFGLGLHKKLHNENSLKELILAYGGLYRGIYILLHFIQSTLLPISNFPTIVAGNLIFSPWENVLLTSIGVITGSLIGFGIGKVFGRKAVDWVVGEENTKRVLKTFEGKENIVLVLILLLPFFPDDIICFIAGITLISWPFFTVSVILLRPLPIIMMVFFGTGQIIPFHGYGLLIWGAIIIACIIGGRYIWNNWSKVNAFLERISKAMAKKRKDD